jgi:hypothetical protein
MPQIAMEPEPSRQLYQLVEALIQESPHILLIVIIVLVVGHKPCHVVEELSILKISV